MDDVSVDLRTLAGDPFATRGGIQQSRPTQAELVEAIFADELELGRPHRPTERKAYCRAFLSPEHVEQVSPDPNASGSGAGHRTFSTECKH